MRPEYDFLECGFRRRFGLKLPPSVKGSIQSGDGRRTP